MGADVARSLFLPDADPVFNLIFLLRGPPSMLRARLQSLAQSAPGDTETEARVVTPARVLEPDISFL
jgi:hypothetical protein